MNVPIILVKMEPRAQTLLEATNAHVTTDLLKRIAIKVSESMLTLFYARQSCVLMRFLQFPSFVSVSTIPFQTRCPSALNKLCVKQFQLYMARCFRTVYLAICNKRNLFQDSRDKFPKRREYVKQIFV